MKLLRNLLSTLTATVADHSAWFQRKLNKITVYTDFIMCARRSLSEVHRRSLIIPADFEFRYYKNKTKKSLRKRQISLYNLIEWAFANALLTFSFRVDSAKANRVSQIFSGLQHVDYQERIEQKFDIFLLFSPANSSSLGYPNLSIASTPVICANKLSCDARFGFQFSVWFSEFF